MNYFSSMQPLWKVPKGQSVKNHYRVKKQTLLLGKNTMTNLDSVLKSRDNTLPTKAHMCSQGCGLPRGHVQLGELDSKGGGGPRDWCLWTMVLRSLLRVPWTARRPTQSTFREINSEYLLKGLLLKLRLPYFGHLMQTADSLEKSLMLGKIEGRRRRGHQKMR